MILNIFSLNYHKVYISKTKENIRCWQTCIFWVIFYESGVRQVCCQAKYGFTSLSGLGLLPLLTNYIILFSRISLTPMFVTKPDIPEHLKLAPDPQINTVLAVILSSYQFFLTGQNPVVMAGIGVLNKIILNYVTTYVVIFSYTLFLHLIFCILLLRQR